MREHGLAPVAERLEGEALQRLLPHRFPFLFLDSLEALENGANGRRARGVKRVTGGECLLDPVTGVPLHWPNLLVLEGLAQATALILADVADGAAAAIGYFARMEQVKLRDPALPGDTLAFYVELLRMRGGVARIRGEARVGTRLVARAIFTVALRATADGGR